MEVETLTKKQLIDLNLCSHCRIKPRVHKEGKKYKESYCTECYNALVRGIYGRMKSTGVSRRGVTYEARMLQMYRFSAKKRKLEFNLTDEQAIEIMHQPCHYCKLPKSMGIDRVDSKTNYELDTVVSCCGQCNRAKHTQSAEQYETWLDGVVERRINSAQNRDSQNSLEKTDHVGTAEN